MSVPLSREKSVRLQAAIHRVLQLHEVRCRCGHNLQGSREPQCAECGRRIVWLEESGSRSPREQLADLLEAVDLRCVECGYDLRDCVGVQCPECGKVLDALELLEKAAEPYWQRFVAVPLMAMFACCGAIGIVMGATTVLQLMKRGSVGSAVALMMAMVFVVIALAVMRASRTGSRWQLLGSAGAAGAGIMVLWGLVTQWL